MKKTDVGFSKNPVFLANPMKVHSVLRKKKKRCGDFMATASYLVAI